MLGVKRRPRQNLGDLNLLVISSTCESWKWTQARNTTQRWGKLIVVMDVKFLRLWWNGGVRKLKMKKYKDSEWWLWELPEAVSWYPVKIKPNNTAQWSKKKPYCYFLICELLPWRRNCNRINMHRRKMNELQKLPCNSCKKNNNLHMHVLSVRNIECVVGANNVMWGLGRGAAQGPTQRRWLCVRPSVCLSVCLCRSTRRNITIFPICNMPSPAAASALQRVCGVGGRPGASCTMVPPLLGRRRLIMHEDILS